MLTIKLVHWGVLVSLGASKTKKVFHNDIFYDKVACKMKQRRFIVRAHNIYVSIAF